LLVSVALLPLLWAGGVLPSLLDLLLWTLEQVELHFLGGSQLLTLLLSLGASGAIAWGGRRLEAEKSVEFLVLASICLFAAACLTCLTPLDSAPASQRCWRMLGCWLQVLAAGGLLVPCIAASFPRDVLLPLRLALEQVALLLTLLAVYVIGQRQLSISCCGMRNGHYLRHRQKMWLNEGTRHVVVVEVSEEVMEVTDALAERGADTAWLSSKPLRCQRHVARQVETIELLARILLLLQMSFFGTADLLHHRGSEFWYFFLLVALQLRQLRISFADAPRAALDAALAGLLHLGLQYDQAEDGWLPVAVLRQRVLVLWSLIRRLDAGGYVLHVSWITWATPKLRHPVTALLLWLNVLFWPGLLLLLVLCALLESPVMAIFSLPLFTLAAPRWSRASAGAAGTDAPLVKGAEGLFYAIAVPSLLRGLALQWRAQTLRKTPGTLLFCRSHERLACVVRVLATEAEKRWASGFGWMQLELRGLELQEPTSCHHVEAGKIDEAFAHAFEGERAPERPSFVLRAICEVPCSTYEQSLISLRGLLDNPQLLRQIHGLFLKSLVWVLSLEEIPEGWLTCPLKPQDAKEVFQLISDCLWPPHISVALRVAHGSPSSTMAPSDTPERTSSLRAAANAPRPPPGTPPIIRPPQKAVDAVPPSDATMSTTMATTMATAEMSPGARSDSEGVEDLDTLMDQVLGMAPSVSRKRAAAPAHQAARRLLATEGDPSEEAWAAKAERPQVMALNSLPGNSSSTLANGTGSASLGAMEDERTSAGVPAQLGKPTTVGNQPLEELSPLARLVIEAYVAVNVAPLYGQKPEAHGTSHVLRLFSGDLARSSQETTELKWLVERPELFQLTLRAFRFAVKISIDAAAMGEEVDMEYQAFAELADELRCRWFLGVEGSLQWEAAMKRGWPNLMALRSGKGVSEVQVLRLRYSEDVCRVAELRPGVWSSLWASAGLELRYLANDDDERYSIQAHPTLFRNMAVQCAEYPIFVSRRTLWL
ncbi:unnamed protein product, partial [Cladocopium goreaui]